MKQANRLFSKDEISKIEKAVWQAEKSTTGEIVPMLADKSDEYSGASTAAAFLLSIFTLSAAAIILNKTGMIPSISSSGLFGKIEFMSKLSFTGFPLEIFIIMLLLLVIPFRYIISAFPGIMLPFISEKKLQAAVNARALRGFYENGLHRTKNETGIVIFISLFERKVVILGDRGINSRIAPDFWKSLSKELVSGFRDGEPCDALCSVIKKCGEELSRHFPIDKEDSNELSDGLKIVK